LRFGNQGWQRLRVFPWPAIRRTSAADEGPEFVRLKSAESKIELMIGRIWKFIFSAADAVMKRSGKKARQSHGAARRRKNSPENGTVKLVASLSHAAKC